MRPYRTGFIALILIGAPAGPAAAGPPTNQRASAIEGLVGITARQAVAADSLLPTEALE